MSQLLPPICFLGSGRLANALIKGFLKSGLVKPQQITTSSKSGVSAQTLAAEYGIKAASDNISAIEAASIIFLCTKPADALATLSALRPHLNNKLIISVAAGIRTASLFEAAGNKARIIRTMPNTAVRVGKGVTSITAHASATKEDIIFTKNLFSSVGVIFEIPEKQKDAFTALSGSGPAFALLFLEGLMQGGIEEGLDSALARTLAAHTLAAAAALILETEDTPEKLRAEITSPNGTTAAGIAELEKATVVKTVELAVHAAKARAEQLAL
ncbi:MAG: pyrroline-5-carboxylate reductase [Chthoniobacterales bacterium]